MAREEQGNKNQPYGYAGLDEDGKVLSSLLPATGFSYDILGVTIDGGGSPITTGSKGFREIPEACTVVGWTIVGDVSGSCVVDVKRATYSGFPTTASIAGSEKPTLSSAQKNQDPTLTTWTTALAAGDLLEFVVDSASIITRVHLFLKVQKA